MDGERTGRGDGVGVFGHDGGVLVLGGVHVRGGGGSLAGVAGAVDGGQRQRGGCGGEQHAADERRAAGVGGEVPGGGHAAEHTAPAGDRRPAATAGVGAAVAAAGDADGILGGAHPGGVELPRDQLDGQFVDALLVGQRVEGVGRLGIALVGQAADLGLKFSDPRHGSPLRRVT